MSSDVDVRRGVVRWFDSYLAPEPPSYNKTKAVVSFLHLFSFSLLVLREEASLE